MGARSRSKSNKYSKDYLAPGTFSAMAAEDKISGIALFLMAAVIPLVVKYAEVPMGPDQMEYITTLDTAVDMFSYHKSILILIGSVVLLLCIGAYATSEKLHSLINWKKLIKNPLFIGFAVFFFGIVGSSIFSHYKYTVTHGISERYESVYILLCYFVIFSAALIFVRGEYQCRFLLYGLLFSCFFIGLIGTFQFFRMDFFMTGLARRLVIDFDTDKLLTSPFSGDPNDPNSVFLSYTTLYNPNSVGAYCALMLPVTVVGAVYYNKGALTRALFIACAIGTLFTAIGCNSSSGLAGLAASVVVTLVIFASWGVKSDNPVGRKAVIGVIGGLFAMMAVVGLVSPLRNRLAAMVEKLLSGGTPSTPFFFKDIGVDGNFADIMTENGVVRITKTADGLLASDGAERIFEPASAEENGQSIVSHYSVEGLGDFTVSSVEGMFAFLMGEVSFIFSYDENNALTPVSKMMKPIDISQPVPSYGFEGHELWASSRGYIWSRTFPLLWKRVIFGGGPDTYIIDFPQDDIVGKVRYLGNPDIKVDKAHNLFLQTAVNTGILSMLAFLFIFGWYIATNFFSVVKGMAENEERWLFAMRAGILAGVCGYAVTSMTTDSTVSVAPVFWMFLGMGVALQRRLAHE